jgi:hypothetical protein
LLKNSVSSCEELFEWFAEVKNGTPLTSESIEFIIATGLRFGGAVNAFDLIVELNARGKLESS